MNLSHIDSDRLADAARGASWSAAETEHLAECAECRLELELVTAARRLGVEQTVGLASARMAQAVLNRLAAEPSESWQVLRSRAPWLVGLAAAAALALAVWYGSTRMPTPAGSIDSDPVELSVLHELDDLDAPELEEVLESIPLSAGAVSHLEPAPFVELNVSDLERVLRSMEE